MSPEEACGVGPGGAGVTPADLGRYLPHRPPFLLIDRVLEAGIERAVAVKCVSGSDPVLAGHFPLYPIYPGVLLLEAMGQTGRFLDPSEGADIALLAKIDAARFLAPVMPGDQLLLCAYPEGRLGAATVFRTEATVEGRLVAKARFTVVQGVET